MNETPFDAPTHAGFFCSFDGKMLDESFVIRELSQTYWASGRPTIVTLRAIEHSICCGVYESEPAVPDEEDFPTRHTKQVGFARAVTDYATFAWICDVVVAKEHRGKGLGKFVVRTLLSHPAIGTIPCMLRTHDAHGLYAQMGFKPVDAMRRLP
jgi:GNAT superfamily N-acetyltransferase